MEFRFEEVTKKRSFLEKDIDKRELLLNKYEKLRNTFSVINMISAVLTTSTGAGGIITTSTIALLPVSITLYGITAVCGISLLLSKGLHDCLSNKIEKHNNIKLAAINKLETINRIVGQDENLDYDEYKLITTHFEEFHKVKSEIANKCKNNVN